MQNDFWTWKVGSVGHWANPLEAVTAKREAYNLPLGSRVDIYRGGHYQVFFEDTPEAGPTLWTLYSSFSEDTERYQNKNEAMVAKRATFPEHVRDKLKPDTMLKVFGWNSSGLVEIVEFLLKEGNASPYKWKIVYKAFVISSLDPPLISCYTADTQDLLRGALAKLEPIPDAPCMFSQEVVFDLPPEIHKQVFQELQESRIAWFEHPDCPTKQSAVTGGASDES